MKIALLGYGKMGQMVEAAASRRQIEVACVIDPLAGSRGQLEDADVCIDFSEPSAVIDNLKRVAAARRAMVVGATMGSYAVEQFGIRGFDEVTLRDVNVRMHAFEDLTHVSLAEALA